MPKTLSRAIARSERGQGIVEFAIVASLLMLLFLGTVDFARFMYYDTAIRSAARVGLEVGMNHCPTPINCTLTTATNDFVIQATACEAAPTVQLQPQPSSCAPCPGSSCSGTPTSTCNAACLANNCQQDICVKRWTDSTTGDPMISVSVGDDFRPISPFLQGVSLPLLGGFNVFSTQPCWTGDTTPHTLCATVTGRVS